MEEIAKRETMTSLEIAEVTGKAHKELLRSIRNMEPAWEKICGRKFALTSQLIDMPNGGMREEPCYSLDKTECLYIATKFNDEARARLVIRWEELETATREQFQVPQSFADALMLAAKQQQKIEEQQKQLEANSKEIIELSGTISSMQQKITYVDMILSSKETVATTQIAQDYGLSAKVFNALLRDFGIQHKVGGQWILYAKYLPCGYVQSDTISITHKNGAAGSVMHTKWTQKGRLFLYEELKRRNIVPLVEQNRMEM